MQSVAGLLLLTALAVPSPAQPRSDPRADAVIDRAIAAMGGLDRIHALRSLVMRGFHYEGAYHQEYVASHTGSAVMVRMRPNLRLVGCRPEVPGCNGQWGRILESYDGTRGWELNWPRQRLVRTVHFAERALRCGAEFDPLFVDWRARGFAAAWLGRQRLLGRDTVAVTITPRDCPAETYYFDPQSYRLVMKRFAIPVHARGAAVDSVQVVQDYRNVAGVELPARTEEVALADGHVLGGGAWTSIEANILPDASPFQAPEVHPTGSTAVVLHMLEAAGTGTPQAMMALYEAYRATPEGAAADTTYDMNWLGYELLKVDAYPAARAVFERVIAEHPQSAEAWDSLGDFWLQQGDRAQALAAFEHALALDPNRPETIRKRDSLRAPAS
jgi:hypothetical protein